MKEVWKDIEGYEKMYQISNLGNVRSLDRLISHYSGKKRKWKGMILRPAISKATGYLSVVLNKKGKSKTGHIHVLVANHFLKRKHHHQCVNHLDSDKTNNVVSNLEWTTFKGNTQHAISNGFIDRKSCLTDEEVISIMKSLLSTTRLSVIFGVSKSTIKRIRSRSLKCYQRPIYDMNEIKSLESSDLPKV